MKQVAKLAGNVCYRPYPCPNRRPTSRLGSPQSTVPFRGVEIHGIAFPEGIDAVLSPQKVVVVLGVRDAGVHVAHHRDRRPEPLFSRVHDDDVVEYRSTINGPEHVGHPDVEGDLWLEDRVAILVADLVLVDGPQDEPTLGDRHGHGMRPSGKKIPGRSLLSCRPLLRSRTPLPFGL